MPTAADKPGLDAILEKVLHAVPFQLTTDGGAEAARQRFRDLPRRPVHQDLRVEDRTVPGPAGGVRVRLYWPPGAGSAAVPMVMFFHGGGWVVGDLDSYDNDVRRHAVGSGALVVSVEYRLAPEHPYPAAVDDVWAATRWAAEHAEELGADPDRLAVAGEFGGWQLGRGGGAARARRGRARRRVPAAVVPGDHLGHLAALVHRERERADPRARRDGGVLPVVRPRPGSKRPSHDAGPGQGNGLCRVGTRLHRGRGVRPAARRRRPVWRTARGCRCSGRGARRRDAGARLPRIRRRRARRHRRRRTWAGRTASRA